MQKLTQSWLVLEMTNSGLLLGVSVACQQVPTLLFAVSGGSLADRFDRRQILLVTTTLGVLPAIAMGLVVHFGIAALWMVLVAAVFQGLTDAVEMPARITLVNDIVEPRLLSNAITLNNVIQNAGKLVGPAVAGVLIGSVGVALAFFVNAASYLAVFLGLLMIKPAYVQARTSASRGRVHDTIRYVAGDRDLAAALTLLAVIGLFGYNFPVVVPLLIRDVFGGGAATVGLALTFMGLGGIIGGLSLAGKIKGSRKFQLISAAVFGLTLILTAAAPTVHLTFGALFVTGVASVVFQSASGAYLQLAADPHMRGRITALYVIALAGTSPLGGPMQGAIAELTNARIALLVAASATIVACVATYRHLVDRSRDDHPLRNKPTARTFGRYGESDLPDNG